MSKVNEGFCSTCHKHLASQNPDIVKLAKIKLGRDLCADCFRKIKAGQMPDPGKAALVADRVGAEFFECECGATVPMHESVRVMRKTTRRIERVCTECKDSETCVMDRHNVVTPTHKDWNDDAWTFQPVPDQLIRGVCSSCKLELQYDGQRWRRMTWPALAEAWSKS